MLFRVCLPRFIITRPAPVEDKRGESGESGESEETVCQYLKTFQLFDLRLNFGNHLLNYSEKVGLEGLL